ncbi:uncharacterized protein EKO05_0001203 [Ascochyta rabiei]|uniref:Uncharacterized protein n=1 Tax=Didymella rabiei TaxID=5454 RepID=A0A163J1W7_DIDRA|nr:uncharacterized protein EKO05_0001203 [Ascochyta rabiei]KZM26085.1 hypothetical protein ST47_g2773 [Ascochyta rabiei]UPX10551.1 hypothetical protein EKO05_0001203 [Ascochyta rabiei]
MSDSNPFAFTGLNAPQFSSSDASLRAELARSRQNVTMLQREVQTLKDASGIAQALASAKNQVQEAQRESKRAQMAEKIARKALASLNNMRKNEDEVFSTSDKSDELKSLRRRVGELETQLSETETRLAETKHDLVACQGYLAKDEDSLRAQSEEADSVKKQLQRKLRDAEGGLTKANAEVRQLNEEAGEAEVELEELRKDNPRLEKALDDQKKVVAELNNINDNLVADLVQEQAQRKALARERDGFEIKLAETLLALRERGESEAEARNNLALFVDEMEQTAHGTNKRMEELQVQMDTHNLQVHDYERKVALKDERIAYLERNNEVLEDRLQETSAHRPVNDRILCPPTYRSVSNFSHSSMADELGLSSDAEFDDYESVYARSDDDEPAEMSVDLQLSGVREIIGIAPHNTPTPSSTCISDTASTSTQKQLCGSSLIEFSPVSNVHSIEPVQTVDLTLSMYDETVACFSPSDPAALKFSLYVEMVECLSPIEPKLPLFAHSSIHEALDYAPAMFTTSIPDSPAEPSRLSSNLDELLNYPPVEPTPPTPPATPEAEFLGLHVIEHASLSLEPINPRHVKAPSSLRDSPIESSLQKLLPAQAPMNDAKRYDSVVTAEASNAFRRRRSPLNPVARLRNHTDTNVVDDLSRIWPLADGTQAEPSSPQGPPPSSPRVHYMFVQNNELSSFFHYLLHTIFVFVCLYCWTIKHKLYSWEHANGVGFGEGYGNVHDRYGSPYGNGHYLLGMLPINLLSADSLLPERAVVAITSTVSALENWVGLGPTPLC